MQGERHDLFFHRLEFPAPHTKSIEKSDGSHQPDKIVRDEDLTHLTQNNEIVIVVCHQVKLSVLFTTKTKYLEVNVEFL